MTRLGNRTCRHGSPYDRGRADGSYGRDYDPHYYHYGTYVGDRVEEVDMSDEQIGEYQDGYRSEAGEAYERHFIG
ncbi:hypothetical protein CMI37_31125 [Candidatus Pacearchaeota archaeon]|nr:hypothetical protein [Candidatus Pacearchaeota archaeon]